MYGKLQKRLIEKPGLAFQRFSLFNKINNMVQFHLENYQDVTVFTAAQKELSKGQSSRSFRSCITKIDTF